MGGQVCRGAIPEEAMYKLIFALIYHTNARGGGDDPRGTANMVLALFQFLHFFVYMAFALYMLGYTRKDYGAIQGFEPILYGVIALAPFYLFNSLHFKGKRMERILERYPRSRVLRPIPIILVLLLLVIPIILLATTDEIRH